MKLTKQTGLTSSLEACELLLVIRSLMSLAACEPRTGVRSLYWESTEKPLTPPPA